MKTELLRLRFDEQVRSEKRKSAGTAIESHGGGRPQALARGRDAAPGRRQRPLPAGRVRRRPLAGAPGRGDGRVQEPGRVLPPHLSHREPAGGCWSAPCGASPARAAIRSSQLQTNFGGGKTHSMLALYHLFSGTAPTRAAGRRRSRWRRRASRRCRRAPARRAGRQQDLARQSRHEARRHRRAHAVGRAGLAARRQEGVRAHPGRRREGDEPRRRAARAVQRVRAVPDPDRRVGGLRAQLHDQSDLPAGSFETQFTFAQALTESAKLAKNCLLVISLPASDTAGSPHAQADDVEVGGERGREALDRLRNVVGRVESSWRPASAEEGFEIVRRRLFEPLADPTQFKDRDVVARAFADLYRTQHQEFPPECRDADYEKRIKAAYPIHPEIFDRLYNDWSTLVKFQRTRGVLRLMAAVIHSLWEKGDQQPAHPAGEHLDRRPARAVRADPLPLGQLGAGDREGRGRPQLAAAAAGRRESRTWASSRPAGAWRARSTWARRPRRRRPIAASRIGGSSSAA